MLLCRHRRNCLVVVSSNQQRKATSRLVVSFGASDPTPSVGGSAVVALSHRLLLSSHHFVVFGDGCELPCVWWNGGNIVASSRLVYSPRLVVQWLSALETRRRKEFRGCWRSRGVVSPLCAIVASCSSVLSNRQSMEPAESPWLVSSRIDWRSLLDPLVLSSLASSREGDKATGGLEASSPPFACVVSCLHQWKPRRMKAEPVARREHRLVFPVAER